MITFDALTVDQIVNGAITSDWDSFIASLVTPDCCALSPADLRILLNGGAVICSSDDEEEPLRLLLIDGRTLIEGSPFWEEPNKLLPG